MLSACGQQVPALQAAQEAVGIRRELAALCPNVFQRDLAMSLIVLARQIHDVSNAVDAVPFAREAVATLQSEFLRHPDAHVRLMQAMVREYLKMCESADEEPDHELLGSLRSYSINKE
jgi:hypothetical protein